MGVQRGESEISSYIKAGVLVIEVVWTPQLVRRHRLRNKADTRGFEPASEKCDHVKMCQSMCQCIVSWLQLFLVTGLRTAAMVRLTRCGVDLDYRNASGG